MKIHFEPDLDFQQQAIESVCRIFGGQEINRSEFTVTSAAVEGQLGLGYDDGGLGYGNRVGLREDQVLENLTRIQTENGLSPSEALTSSDFTIEMETGTGKTYVYLRTVFELNKRYGFTKFVIIVPSVAVREGVHKTLRMTEEHFKSLYSGQPYEYFVYDSSKLGQVRNFATSSKIQMMVVTVGAINKKDVNNLYKDSEKTGGERPIDLIKATHPVLIVDEPQSVDGGLRGRGKEALEAMNPLCTLRYSATHVDRHHMVYRLDAVDAYERKLVKQIEVAGSTIENAHNLPYVRLLSTKSERGTVTALVELDRATGRGRAQRVQRRVEDGDDLEQETRRELYRNVLVGEIRAGNDPWMELRVPGSTLILRPGEAHGDVDENAVAREMIRRTIKEDSIHGLMKAPRVPKSRLQWRKGSVKVGQAGVEAEEIEGAQSVHLKEEDIVLPDILTELQDRTQLTRRSIYRILTESNRLAEFRQDPQRFIEQAADIINRTKRHALVDGIKYRKIGDGEYYAQELFQEHELLGYLSRLVEDETNKSVYEEIVYDSDTEKSFAQELKMNSAVRLFAKLPAWFTVPTPLGSYNPDWAVVIEDDGADRVYFVVETKGSLFDLDRRAMENYKIECGRRHVEALATEEPTVRYEVATDLHDVLEAV